jgi:hypothetical protein
LNHEVEYKRVLEKLSFFKKSAVWPVEFKIEPEEWLKNFEPDEFEVAIALLDGFAYYAPEVTKKILTSSFHRLSIEVAAFSLSNRERSRRWDEFRSRVIVTYPTDERPGATDSGRSYLRKARTVLGIDTSQYMDPHEALAAKLADSTKPLLFLDDFAGSGSQFCKTWRRPYPASGGVTSFQTIATDGMVAYIPTLCSHEAVHAILDCAPRLLLRPGHVLGEEYSVFHPQSIIWPSEELQSKSGYILRKASERAGIPLGDGSDPDDWCGFAGLGLAVAIDDTIPDACVTLLYWADNGWRPLFRRP